MTEDERPGRSDSDLELTAVMSVWLPLELRTTRVFFRIGLTRLGWGLREDVSCSSGIDSKFGCD